MHYTKCDGCIKYRCKAKSNRKRNTRIKDGLIKGPKVSNHPFTMGKAKLRIRIIDLFLKKFHAMKNAKALVVR